MLCLSILMLPPKRGSAPLKDAIIRWCEICTYRCKRPSPQPSLSRPSPQGRGRWNQPCTCLIHLPGRLCSCLLGCALVVMEVFIPSGGMISVLAAVSFICLDLHCVRGGRSAAARAAVHGRDGGGRAVDAGDRIQVLAEDADGQGVSGRAAERGGDPAGGSAAGSDWARGRGAVEDVAQRGGGDRRPDDRRRVARSGRSSRART